MEQRFEREVEYLRSKCGFDEKQAQAAWHLLKARDLMVDIKQAQNIAEMEAKEEKGELGERFWAAVSDRTHFESRVFTPFSTLLRELGVQVLRRDYPEGWGSEFEGVESANED